MAKFCGCCGSPLDGNTGLCPNCNKINVNKKNNKKLLLIILAVVVAVAVVLCVGANFDFSVVSTGSSSDSSDSAIFDDKGKEYYLSGGGNAFLLDEETVNSVKEIADDSGLRSITGLAPTVSVYDGKYLYGRCGDDRTNLYKYSFNEDGTVEKSVWVSEKVLNNSVVVNDIGYYTGNMMDWTICGEYVYFICIPGLEFRVNQYDIAYKLGRISKDGKKIEFIGETASTYAIKDGWIYFYDNGFTFDKKDKHHFEIDKNRAGIYKMRTNGSQKKLLLDNFVMDETHDDGYNRMCDKMQVVGDYLYFIDYSEMGKSRICRMKTDGSDVQYITQNGSYIYTVDTDSNELYYVTGEFGWSQEEFREMYKVSLDSREEHKISEQIDPSCFKLTYWNNYIYFHNSYFYLETNESRTCGMRYSIPTNTLERLNGVVEQNSEFLVNPNTGGYEKKIDEPIEENTWEKQ